MTESNALYRRALQLSKKVDEHFLELARTLRALRGTDPDLFHLFIQNSDMSVRRAYYLIEVDQIFEKLHVPDERLMAIGWTKLQVIGRHVSKKNIKALLRLAETESLRDLKALMKGEEGRTKPRCVLLYFTEEQYAEFTEAVLEFGAAKNGRGLVGKEEAIIAQIQTHKKLLAWCNERFENDGGNKP